ncbi:hypothetical protein CPB86DRAFT_476286 [Serendipita vermifera]|nr:hypothetical protein CPB86DRAFT_476286 [Serendipita vermifera]
MNSSSILTDGTSTATNQATSGDDLATSDSTIYVNLPLLSAHINSKQVLVAFLTWTIYEMVITQERGATLFSNRPWSRSKILFLLVSVPSKRVDFPFR